MINIEKEWKRSTAEQSREDKVVQMAVQEDFNKNPGKGHTFSDGNNR